MNRLVVSFFFLPGQYFGFFTCIHVCQSENQTLGKLVNGVKCGVCEQSGGLRKS